jgi:hypothetical protein
MPTKMRLKELRWVKASDLTPNPNNWRTHPTMQRQAMQGLMDEVGFADVVLAYDRDGTLTLVDGHLRVDLLGDQSIPVGILDVNDDEANKILATLDPLAALAIPDPSVLQALIANIDFDTLAITDMLSEIVFPDYGHTPDLDDLQEEFGLGSDDDFWVQISVRVPRDVKALFDTVMGQQDQDTEAMRFKSILASAASTAGPAL